MHYMIGTKTKARRISGMHGVVLTATVDASFASHPDLKGQSNYGGGGAVMMSSKRQTITPTSSTDSELLSLGALFLPDVQWARNFLAELGYD